MTYSHHIPFLQANGELVPTDALSRVIQSSAETSWKNILMKQHQVPSAELPNLMYKQHVIVVNVGSATNYEFKKSGRFQKVLKPTGTVSFFPS